MVGGGVALGLAVLRHDVADIKRLRAGRADSVRYTADEQHPWEYSWVGFNGACAHKLAAQGQGGAAGRLATYLLHRRQIGGTDVIRLGVSREVLANLLGLARETLSRQLSRFAEAGLVELEGKDIAIRDVSALREIASEGSDR